MKIPCFFVYTVTAAILISCLPTSACDSGTVRDAAFQNKRDVHRLCVFSHAGDASADAAFQRLEAWRKESADFNVTLERVNADDAAVDWTTYGIPSAPPQLPVTALIAEFPPGRAFVIDHWEPAPEAEALQALQDSPARQQIKDGLINAWAVILYAPGSARQTIDPMIESVSRKWAETQSPGLAVVRFDPADPHERVLRGFTGAKPSEDWLGVIYGRGRLLAPPMRGPEISEAGLNGLLEGLAAKCTCLQDSLKLGLDIPMAWPADLTSKVLGTTAPQGYTEISLDASPEKEEPAAALAAEIPDESAHVLVTALVPLAVAGLVVGVVIAVMLFRRNHRGPMPSEGGR
jgi:hypothetical protein